MWRDFLFSGFFILQILTFIVNLSMHLHIHIPTDTKAELESHKKLVCDIRHAVAEQKRVQCFIDFFVIVMFLAFLMYSVAL